MSLDVIISLPCKPYTDLTVFKNFGVLTGGSARAEKRDLSLAHSTLQTEED